MGFKRETSMKNMSNTFFSKTGQNSFIKNLNTWKKFICHLNCNFKAKMWAQCGRFNNNWICWLLKGNSGSSQVFWSSILLCLQMPWHNQPTDALSCLVNASIYSQFHIRAGDKETFRSLWHQGAWSGSSQMCSHVNF